MTERRNEPAKSGADTRFKPGNPGKPVGARSRTTRAIEALLDGDADKLTRKAVELALEGDTVALRLCLERLVPPRKDTPVSIALPPVRSASDVVDASAVVLSALGDGDITPDEAGRVMTLLTAHRAILEVGDLEARIAKLEEKA